MGVGLGLAAGGGDGDPSPAAAAWAASTEALHNGNCNVGLVMLLVAGFTSFGMLGSGLQMAVLLRRSLHTAGAACHNDNAMLSMKQSIVSCNRVGTLTG